jgi:uncharacterized membrane protein YdjX (TVP38/TMEM64 family)
MHDGASLKVSVCEKIQCPKAIKAAHPLSPLPFLRMLAISRLLPFLPLIKILNLMKTQRLPM